MLFSIVVPVYNGEKYLSRCIDSILAQTYDDFEVIIIDDGSTDHSSEICKEYALKDKRVSLISQQNRGVSSARNAGISQARGDYLIFVDADDYVSRELIYSVKRVVDAFPCDVCFWGYTCVSAAGMYSIAPEHYSGNKSAEVLENLIDSNLFGLICNKAIKRNVLMSAGITFDIRRRLLEDQDLMIRLWQYVQTVYCMDKLLYYYVQNNASAMAGIKRIDVTEYVKFHNDNVEGLNEFMLSSGISSDRIDDFFYEYAIMEMGNTFRLLSRLEKDKIYQAAKAIDNSLLMERFKKNYLTRKIHGMKANVLYWTMKLPRMWQITLFRRMWLRILR